MLKSDANKPLKNEDLQNVVGGNRAPKPHGTKNWEIYAKLWQEYANTLEVIPERYAELNEAVNEQSYIRVESIVYNLMRTEPADGPVRKIYNDTRFNNH